MIVGHLPFYQLWKTKFATRWKKRRFDRIMALAALPQDRPARILEAGCANGKDFLQFLDREKTEVWAVDIKECQIDRGDVHFVQADAEKLPFEDGFFDLVVSVGLLEHIEPMEKLCAVISEFDRVGKSQVHIVPSVSGFLEPHSGKLLFPLRYHGKMLADQPGVPLHLNFFTEHTWTKFKGFYDCKIKRYYYLAPLVRNTFIYR